MPYYKSLPKEIREELRRYGLLDDAHFDTVRDRTVDRLRALRDRLGAQIPKRTLNETLLLATWNIREFDSEKYGPRTVECYYYIAEILSAFDLIAIQEVRDNLNALKRVMQILGSSWKVLVTDVTIGQSGNSERLAFLYDERKVKHTGFTGELVLPAAKERKVLQFARTPFMCGFQAGWCQFTLATVHIYYGTSKPDDPRRLQEIDDLARTLAGRTEGLRLDSMGRPVGAKIEPENMVILGDFNIFGIEDETYRTLIENGFTIPDALVKRPGSNLDQSKFYDQIAFMVRPQRFEATGRAGVFNYGEVVYRPDDEPAYTELMKVIYDKAKGKKGIPTTYKEWHTYQMSDHLPLWVELRIDFTEPYLQRVRTMNQNGVAPPEALPPERELSRVKKFAGKKAAKKKQASPKKKAATKKAAKKKGGRRKKAKQAA